MPLLFPQVEGTDHYPRTPLNATTAQCTGVCATRHLAESVIRQQLRAARPEVAIRTGAYVTGLRFSEDNSTVTGGFASLHPLSCSATEVTSATASDFVLLATSAGDLETAPNCPPEFAYDWEALVCYDRSDGAGSL